MSRVYLGPSRTMSRRTKMDDIPPKIPAPLVAIPEMGMREMVRLRRKKKARRPF